jgi:carboxylesterase type B
MTRWWLRPAAATALALGLLAPTAPTATAATGTAGPPTVHVGQGDLRGVRAGAAEQFLGVPYAAPPVGDLRWRAPRPPAGWSGVRDAGRYGNRCPVLPSGNGPRSETEDCLYLNVYRPAGARAGDRRPVYLWIHGGGLQNGSSDQHDGSTIARATGLVVVSINYRLGVFGFLGHPALTAEAGESGNYGLEDQQAALRWVHRNIGAFGGDPRAVTIGGESAGGWSVCAHLVAPGSRGLFAGAVVQSGNCVSQTQAEVEAVGTTLASTVGCADLTCLRRVPAARLLDAAPPEPLLFVRGTRTLPRDPRVAVRRGQFTRVPVIVGATRDEGRTFTQANLGWTREQYVTWLRTTFGADADRVLAHYSWPATADRFTAAYLTGAIFTDAGLLYGIGGCAERRLSRDLARYVPTYAYEFAHRTGPGLSPEPAGYVWGAGHAAELAYHWPSFDNGTPIAPAFTAAERRLAAEMVRYWGAFVRTGRAAVPHQVAWPRHDGRYGVLALRAGGQSGVLTDTEVAAEHRCDLWDAVRPAL